VGRRFVCVCFKKGDYSAAQAYAEGIGVGDVVEWHDVVPFDTLEQYFISADVVVRTTGVALDRAGTIRDGDGVNRLSAGSRQKSKSSFFSGSGLLTVDDVDSLAEQLIKCESEIFREEVGNRSSAICTRQGRNRTGVHEMGDFVNPLRSRLPDADA